MCMQLERDSDATVDCIHVLPVSRAVGVGSDESLFAILGVSFSHYASRASP